MVDDGFNSAIVKSLAAGIVKSLAARISLCVDIGTGVTTLDGKQVRVSVKRKLLVLIIYTV